LIHGCDHEMGGRPVKRARLGRKDDEDSLSQLRGHEFGNITINGPASVHLGDRHESLRPGSPQTTTDHGIDKYEVLLKSLLFDRIDARERNVRKALSRTCEWLFQHKDFQEWRAQTAEQAAEQTTPTGRA